MVMMVIENKSTREIRRLLKDAYRVTCVNFESCRPIKTI